MATSPQLQAQKAAIAFLREARAAGWARAAITYRPDGSLRVDASMSEPEAVDDFDSANLKMGSR